MKGQSLTIHRWVGLKLSILISFVMITGTLATVSHEIDWLIDPARRVLPPVSGEMNWQGLYDAAKTARPTWVVDWIEKPIDPWHAAQVVALTPDGARRRLFVHPQTLDIQGDRPWFNAQRLFRDAHRRLMIPTLHGILIVSLLSLLLAVSIVTGLFVYKKFWRGFFKMPRTRDRRTFWGDMHRLGGLWGLWFAVVIALTGFWYLFEVTMTLSGERGAPLPRVPAAGVHSAQNARSLNAFAKTAHEALPEYEIEMVSPAQFAGDPVVFSGQSQAILVRRRANQVRIASANGQIIDVLDARDMTVLQRLGEMADPLHFGTFGGIWTKLLYFLFGIVLSGMSLSGIYTFSARMRKAASRPVMASARAQTA